MSRAPKKPAAVVAPAEGERAAGLQEAIDIVEGFRNNSVIRGEFLDEVIAALAARRVAPPKSDEWMGGYRAGREAAAKAIEQLMAEERSDEDTLVQSAAVARTAKPEG